MDSAARNFYRNSVFHHCGRQFGVLFGTHANCQTMYVLTLYPHEKARAPEPSLIFVACVQKARCQFASGCNQRETSGPPQRLR